MKLRSLITLEMYQAIRNIPNVSITPYTPRVRLLPKDHKLCLSTLHEYKGDVGRKVLGGMPPSAKTTNIAYVCQQAKTFGIRSNV